MPTALPRPVKYALIGCGALLLLILIGMAMALALFDPNAHKERIARLVREATGRELTLTGDIKLSVFPWIGVGLGPMHLSSPAGFGPMPFVEVKRAEVVVKLLPLISGQVVVKRVDLEGLSLNLITSPDGATTWDGLAGGNGAKADAARPQAPAPDGPSGQKGQAGPDITVGQVRVADARVLWEDKQAKVRYEISGFTLTTGPVNLKDPTDIDLAFKAASSDPELGATVRLKATAALDLAGRTYGLSGTALSVTAEGKALPGGSASLDLAGALALDLAAQTLSARGLTLGVQGLKLLSPPAEPLAAKLAGDVDLDLKAGIAAARGLTLEALGLALSAEPTVRYADGLTVKTDLKMKPGDLRAALARLGIRPDMADSGALTAVGLGLALDLTPGAIGVAGLDLSLDGSRITGEAKVADWKTRPATSFTLAVDALDADRYLPPRGKSGDKGAGPEGGAEKPGKTEDKPGKPGQVIPVDVLRDLRLEGSLAAGRLKVSGLSLENVDLAFKAWDGVVSVKPAKLNLYQGSLAAALALDTAKAEPATAVSLAVSGVQAGPLLRDLTGKESLSGRVNLNADLHCLGDVLAEMKRSLAGKASFHVQDGVFPGVDFLGLAKAATSGAKSGDAGQAGQGKKTDFGELSGSLAIVNGLVSNRDLELKAPALRATGEGTASLVTEQIDYLVKPKLALTGKGQGGRGQDDTWGLTVPIRITGTFEKPGYGLAAGELAKELLLSPVNVADGLTGGVAGGLVKGLGSALTSNRTAKAKTQQPQDGKKKDLLGKLFGK
jgi:AsmA protein